MITLQSIRVRNFRAIKEATFKPIEEGITGITGPNGAGKSTFLTATLFALYGIKPAGASQNSLRRTGSKGESSVSVVFTHMGQQVEIIRELKAPNNRIVVNIYVDGVPQTVTSVGAADAWVKSRLGIDANGFMTAFVVRQKELDQLVNAKPAERKATIERLAGIDTINIALKAARDDENQAKKTLATLPGSEDSVTDAAEALDLSTRKLDKLTSEKDDFNLKINTLDVKLSSLKKKADAIKSSELKIQDLETQVRMFKVQLGEAENELSLMPAPLEEELSIEELRELLKSVKVEIESATEELAEKSESFASVRAEYVKLENDVNNFESKIKAFSPKPDLSTDFVKLIEEKNKLIEDSRDSIATAKSKIADFNESLNALSHADSCPTCQQDLANPEAIVDGIKALLKAQESTLKSGEKALEQARFDLAAHNASFTAQKEYNDASEALQKAQEALKTVSDVSVLKNEIDALKELIAFKTDERDTITERGMNLKNSLSQEESRTTLTNKVSQLANSLETAENEIELLTSSIGGREGLAEIASVNKLESEVQSLRLQLQEVTNSIIVVEQRVGGEKASYKAAKEMWERKKDLLKKQEQAAYTTDLIDKFRSETIAALAPELSEFATSLISEMTSGDFTEIRLDDEFNPSVVDSSGQERPVSWLSGGEESSVALALRLAIAFLITGGDPQLLWLDEILTAQDADRRNTMLSMIRRLPIDQIIMINHTQEAGDIVDKSIEIIPNLIEGSSIKEEEATNEKFDADSADINNIEDGII